MSKISQTNFQADQWVRVPKSDPKYNQRWYINKDTGQRASRREYQQAKAGFIKNEERAKMRTEFRFFKALDEGKKLEQTSSQRLKAIVSKYKDGYAKEHGIRAKDVKVRGNSAQALEFKRLFKEYEKLRARKNFDRSPKGRPAQLLVMLYQRDKGDDRPINSPGKNR